MRPLLTIQVEPWSAALPELSELFPVHWEELGLNREHVKMKCDTERYAALEQQKILLLLTVRSNTRLVGYLVAFLMPHLHYKDAGLMAYTDMYFIVPEFRRGAGVGLFIEFEKALKQRGVIQAITSCKVHQDHEPLFERLGWRWTDKTFSKYLGT